MFRIKPQVRKTIRLELYFVFDSFCDFCDFPEGKIASFYFGTTFKIIQLEFVRNTCG